MVNVLLRRSDLLSEAGALSKRMMWKENEDRPQQEIRDDLLMKLLCCPLF